MNRTTMVNVPHLLDIIRVVQKYSHLLCVILVQRSIMLQIILAYCIITTGCHILIPHSFSQ